MSSILQQIPLAQSDFTQRCGRQLYSPRLNFRKPVCYHMHTIHFCLKASRCAKELTSPRQISCNVEWELVNKYYSFPYFSQVILKGILYVSLWSHQNQIPTTLATFMVHHYNSFLSFHLTCHILSCYLEPTPKKTSTQILAKSYFWTNPNMLAN